MCFHVALQGSGCTQTTCLYNALKHNRSNTMIDTRTIHLTAPSWPWALQFVHKTLSLNNLSGRVWKKEVDVQLVLDATTAAELTAALQHTECAPHSWLDMLRWSAYGTITLHDSWTASTMLKKRSQICAPSNELLFKQLKKSRESKLRLNAFLFPCKA